MFRILLAVILMTIAAPALAHDFERCEKGEIALVEEALVGAEKIALRAAVSIGDTPEYRRWFGPYSKNNAASVRASFKSIYTAINENEIKIVCANIGEEDCDSEMYANVWTHDHFAINLCPSFFEMPRMYAFPSGSIEMENGSREGTIIHEMSHFDVVARTEDICYSRSACSERALVDLEVLIDNADSYQYFAEDISYLQ
ncbi:M35 family metallo-endopeptidase [Pelagovum pacificum]|uniref:Protease n=1 Tax=Pelagovum pacificum TaxID=2588711 RepID=A0A5C5GB46_9RHOB|nr:M35 family metallo-endopeptidase [Pelagovum pacificum]QQA41527.1 protease [Pelagovum pacificum]TNY30807.1 protease [Pelagovum pacificum]